MIFEIERFNKHMHMNISCPENAKILAFYNRGAQGGKPVYTQKSDIVLDPYLDCGCHPDIVIRLWDELGASLPIDCRCLVYGLPALVHPQHGIIMTIGINLLYIVRAPDAFIKEARQLIDKDPVYQMVKTKHNIDTERDFGEDWIYGRWKQYEIDWCKLIYEQYK